MPTLQFEIDSEKLFEGWLYKKGIFNKQWKKRYFVLYDDRTISYFEKKEHTKSRSKAKGSIHLTQIECVERISIMNYPTSAPTTQVRLVGTPVLKNELPTSFSKNSSNLIVGSRNEKVALSARTEPENSIIHHNPNSDCGMSDSYILSSSLISSDGSILHPNHVNRNNKNPNSNINKTESSSMTFFGMSFASLLSGQNRFTPRIHEIKPTTQQHTAQYIGQNNKKKRSLSCENVPVSLDFRSPSLEPSIFPSNVPPRSFHANENATMHALSFSKSQTPQNNKSRKEGKINEMDSTVPIALRWSQTPTEYGKKQMKHITQTTSSELPDQKVSKNNRTGKQNKYSKKLEEVHEEIDIIHTKIQSSPSSFAFLDDNNEPYMVSKGGTGMVISTISPPPIYGIVKEDKEVNVEKIEISPVSKNETKENDHDDDNPQIILDTPSYLPYQHRASKSEILPDIHKQETQPLHRHHNTLRSDSSLSLKLSDVSLSNLLGGDIIGQASGFDGIGFVDWDTPTVQEDPLTPVNTKSGLHLALSANQKLGSNNNNTENQKSKHRPRSSVLNLERGSSGTIVDKAADDEYPPSARKNVIECQRIVGVETDRPYTFALKQSQRLWVMSAETQKECLEWIKLCHKLSQGNRIFSGYLHKRGDKVHSWKKRYFVLFEHKILNYYTAQENTTTSGLVGDVDLRRALWLRKCTDENDNSFTGMEEKTHKYSMEIPTSKNETKIGKPRLSYSSANESDDSSEEKDTNSKDKPQMNASSSNIDLFDTEIRSKHNQNQNICQSQSSNDIWNKGKTISKDVNPNQEKSSPSFLQRFALMKKSKSETPLIQNKEKPKATIKDLPAPYMFELATPGRTWYFCTDDVHVRNTWIVEIQHVLGGKLPIKVLLNGIVDVLVSHNGQQLTSRYACLFPSWIIVFDNQKLCQEMYNTTFFSETILRDYMKSRSSIMIPLKESIINLESITQEYIFSVTNDQRSWYISVASRENLNQWTQALGISINDCLTEDTVTPGGPE